MRNVAGSIPPLPQRACRLILIRHATAECDGHFLGQSDVPLTGRGRRELGRLAAALAPFRVRAIYSSDLQRARTTAAALTPKLGIEPVLEPGLRELHFGRWQGLSWKQIQRRFPKLARLWIERFPFQPIPEGERFLNFKKRVEEQLRQIVAANVDRCVLIVTHAGVIRVALATALGIRNRDLFRLAQDPCAINVIDYLEDGIVVRSVNG